VVAVQAAEVEAEDDLADAVALGAGELLELLEADCPDELADQHALARERADHVGDDDEGCPRKIRASDRWFWASSS
jgi:hypothetical protein